MLHAVEGEKYAWLVNDQGFVCLEIHDPVVRSLAEEAHNREHHPHAQAVQRNYREIIEASRLNSPRELGSLSSWLESRRTCSQRRVSWRQQRARPEQTCALLW